MSDTVSYEKIAYEDTIPMICEEHSTHLKRAVFKTGDDIYGYSLVASMAVTAQSEVWYCKDYSETYCVIKLSTEKSDEEVIQQIYECCNDNIVPILEYGEYQDKWWYEVYPFYRNGSLQGTIGEEQIKKIVLPGIAKALKEIHGLGIVHNDIKPENIFWNDSMDKILLGDFGNACLRGRRAKGLTIPYASPELLLNSTVSCESDWCSVGLLIAKIFSGNTIINAQTKQQALRIWERGINFQCDNAQIRQLVRGMTSENPQRRLGVDAIKQWSNDDSFSSEGRISRHEEVEEEMITIAFDNPKWVAADIDGLIKGIEEHWEYSVFLYEQAGFDRFLTQFDPGWEEKCKRIRRENSEEDALFKLSIELTAGEAFVWRGHKYDELTEMEYVWDDDRGEEDIVAFLQKGHVVYILRQKNAPDEKIDYAKGLQNLCRTHPYEACAQLFSALRGEDGVQWDGILLNDLNDVVDWLETKENNLDEAVEAIFESKKFEAWFTFQGMNGVLENIRRRVEV